MYGGASEGVGQLIRTDICECGVEDVVDDGEMVVEKRIAVGQVAEEE